MRFEESNAYPEENECDYRNEWDDRLVINYGKSEHQGSGSEFFTNYDQAWDDYVYRRDKGIYFGLKMIEIHPDGSESVRYQA